MARGKSLEGRATASHCRRRERPGDDALRHIATIVLTADPKAEEESLEQGAVKRHQQALPRAGSIDKYHL